MPAPLTRIYADFIAGASLAVVPPQALEVARLGFTDCLGVLLAGRHEDLVQRLARHVHEQGGRAESRLASGGARVGMVQAALVNASCAHALDYDDFAFSNHPSAVLVPTILAAADARPCSGARMALAYLVGYEIWADLMLRESDLYYDKGWHPTAVLGPIGAAAAGCVVLGLDAGMSQHALALAASDAGGVFENFGTMAKPWHGGRAAAAGLQSASLARAGLAASPTALEGSHGLMRAISPHGKVDLERWPELGQLWRSATLRLNIKKHPTVGASQRVIDAVLALGAGQRPDAAQIASITVKVSERHAAVMPYHLPQDALQAKFSIEFALCCALLHKAVGFAQLQDAVVRAAPMQALMAKVKIQTTAEFEPEWRDAAPFDEVLFDLHDGQSLASPKVRRASGHADTPLNREQLLAKFLGCTRHTQVVDSEALALFEAMQRIDHLQSAAEIALPD